MPEPTLTAKEMGKLARVMRDWLASEQAEGSGIEAAGQDTANLITAALAAVPRLALAAPVVGEVRSKVAEARALVGYGTAYERLHVEGLLADALAALTGGEGRDG